ncbi:MAG: hypothetical protein Q4F41_00340 [Eubacteriales bacterium]|nr:hypothetical protein [Eubacteriales bacterium]
MQVDNRLAEDSFHYTEICGNLGQREEELIDLAEIADYCEKIEEKIRYDGKIYDIEVEEGIPLTDWLYLDQGTGSEDERRLLLELLEKNFELSEEKKGTEILIALGEHEGAASDRKGYLAARRELLAGIGKPEEYSAFMGTCFPQSVFADDIGQEMKYIKDFPAHAKEITECLSVLNDEAVELYEEYRYNLQEAIQILSAKLLECSLDSNHRQYLKFRFTYEEVLKGEKRACTREISCEPHLKLIRKDSDLRIYFWWCDEKIEKGEKVLVGRIGRHPYA